MRDDDTRVARPTAHYPPADMSPTQFEEFVAELLGAAAPVVDNLRVTLHQKITRPDGTYNFDATIRYEFAGMSFLVLVEAKKHSNPIKRELVQVLHQKVGSVGGHKGVMIATAPYQSGALLFAKEHGIALVTVTEGRFIFESRGAVELAPMSREEAAELFDAPTFVSHYYGPGEETGTTRVWLLSNRNDEYPQHVARFLLGCSWD